MVTPTASPARTAVVTPAPSVTVPTVTAAPKPTEKPAIELVTEVNLPAPEEGDWYEWDRVGNYSTNLLTDGSTIYVEDEDLLVRALFWDSLIVSNLDGSNKRVLERGYDNQISGPILYYNGWIYYKRLNQPWKIKPDGSEMTQVIDSPSSFMFIYDGLFYTYWDSLVCIGLDGENERTIDLPGGNPGYFIFDDGYLYYRANEIENNSSIYRYQLTTGEVTDICNGEMRPSAVRDGWIYYGVDEAIYRTDGNATEKIVERQDLSTYKLAIYRNYLLFFNMSNICYALNLDTLEVTHLYLINPDDINIMNNCILGGMYYQITFEDDKAQIWRLNWMLEEEHEEQPEEGVPGE